MEYPRAVKRLNSLEFGAIRPGGNHILSGNKGLPLAGTPPAEFPRQRFPARIAHLIYVVRTRNYE